ncbi:tRNA(Glu)-specific nuclease WapA precursor [Symmachiella dynata]|uniref:putative Ig domain-containing protein n=1 Tax=Symmachiella dynata TaxID=2527995 RepID=UPI001188EFA9|nr:putative Ig domain-containing protein [Symmachiella dynata]QDT46981.1 tRNA(Glu)-specific nuclease WapA precursor [Symmachiella dynata]
MLFTPWLEAVRTRLVIQRYKRREKSRRMRRFRNMSNPIEVLEDRTLMTVNFAISGDTSVTEDTTDGDSNEVDYTISYTGTIDVGETASVDVSHLLDETDAADYSTNVVSAITTAAGNHTDVSFDGTTLTFEGIGASSTDVNAYAGSATQDSSGDEAWANLSNATGDTSSTFTVVEPNRNDLSHTLRLTNFGFSIPTGATIDGITAVLKTTGSDGPDNESTSVKITKNGTSSAGTGTIASGSWSGGTLTVGSDTNQWGTTWTAAEINASTFGLLIQVEGDSNGDEFNVYTANLKIDYTTGGSPTTSLNFTVVVNDDSVVESDEDFSVTLSNAAASGAGSAAITTASVETTIVNSDVEFAISATATTVTEDSADGDGNAITYTIGYTGTLEDGVVASVDVSHVLNESDLADYETDVIAAINSAKLSATGVAFDGTTLTFSGGAGNDVSLDFTVVVADDIEAEDDEAFGVTLSNAAVSGSGTATIGTASANATIVNHEVIVGDVAFSLTGGALVTEETTDGDSNQVTYTISYDGVLEENESASVDVSHVLNETLSADYTTNVVEALTTAAANVADVSFDGTTLTFLGPQVSSTTGSGYAGSAAVGTTADDAWSDIGNAEGNTSGTAATVDTGGGDYSDELLLTDFDLNIPTGATIDGIKVTLITGGNNPNNASSAIKITKNGTTATGTAPTPTGTWSSGSVVLGDATALWGTTWTAAELNTSDFGLIVQLRDGDFELYSAHIEVAYTSSNAGSETKSLDFTVEVNDDVAAEEEEAYSVTLSNAATSGSGTASIETATAASTIVNNDVEFAISASALKVTEDPTDGDGNSITYTVGYTGALATGETASIDVAHLLQHTNEADYDTTVAAALATAVSGATGISLSGTTLTFSGGTGNDTSLDFTVVIDNDADPEPDKEYSVAIHNAEVSGSGSATISEILVTSTIINDDVELDDGVQIIGGGELPAPNPATGDVDPTSIEVNLLPQEQSEHTVTLSFDDEYAPTADVVFIVDESGSMEDEHAWIAGMVTSLDSSLNANGVTGNRYSLVGYLGEGTLFSMTPEPVIVTIYGPDGTQLESQQLAVETTTGLIEGSFTLPASGDYTIVVDHAGSTSSYDYSFVLEDASPVGGSAALVLDELTTGQIQTDGETHEYTFSLSGSDTLFFESLTTDTDLRWSLTGPSGAVVTDRDFDAGGLKIDGESGSYTLTIDGPSEATGSYAFRLLNLSGSSITAGTQINGTLDPATDSLVYELSATAGDRYYFNSQSSSLPAGAQWRLIDPSGTELFSQSLSEDHDPLTTSSTGTYYLVVDGDVADTASTRAFSFTVESLGATSSTALSFGTGYSGSISKAGEADEYTFTLTGDELLAFDSQTDDGDLAWTLSEATAGTVIADVPLDASDIVLRLGVGTYTLSIDPPGDATGSYDFQILDLASATSLTVDSTESGNLNPASSTAAYKFTAAAGDKYSFDAISWAGSAAAHWRLIDPFGNELFGAAIGNDVPTLHVHAAGDYTLLLEGAIDDSTSNPAFSFEVVDEGSDTSDPAPLALNQVVSGVISASLEEDEYTFTLGSAALVSFDSLTGRDDMYWSLADGGGTIVNSRALDAADASGVSNANAVLSLSSGTYTLTIDADSGITGDYAFAVLDLSSATTITVGSDVTGAIAASHRTAVYEFTAGAGDQFGFQSVNWAGDADATWRLVNSSGTVLTSGELGASTGLFELTAGGTYTLLVEGTLDDTPVTRPYAFQIELLELSSTSSLSATNSGSISSAGDLHAFTFSATAGESYFVDFADAATTDHYLSIRNAAGVEVARVAYDSAAQPNSVMTFTVAESGTYTVVVGADNSSTGSFEFRLIELDGNNLTAIDADTAGDFTASGERDVFHFEGAAGREVNLRIDAWGTAAQMSAASGRLIDNGGTEDGYDAIDEALQHLRFRDNAATHFILITDEDRDNTSPNLTYNDIFNDLDTAGYTLHSIVNMQVDTTNQTENALGIDGAGTSNSAYYADGSGGYTSETSGGVAFTRYSTPVFDYNNNITTEADYIDLAFDLEGTTWDLHQLRAGGLTGATAAQVLATESFTAAFVDILTNKITADQMDLVSTDPNVTFEILSETLTEDDISYDIRFTGDGTQYVFDLQFVRDQNGTDTVLGTIPVTLRTHYVQLTENSNFQTLYEDALTIPADAEALELRFFDLQFDTADGTAINDAFELALLDSDGNPLAGTIGGGRDAFFNMTEGEDPLLGGGVVYDAETGTVTLDISHLPEGLAATLAVRLVNNDADSTSTVSVDVHPTILTTSPVANPSLTSPSGDGHAPNTIDFDHMIDVTAAVSWEYQVTSFDESSDTLFTGLTLTNDGISPIRGPLLVAVHHIDNPRVQATGYDGLTPDGYAYFDVTLLMEDGMLDPAAALSGLALRFHNPQQVQFNYELQILADLNRSPEFVSDPVTEVVAGESYEYDAAAVDPDGDAVTYSILSGPDTMAIDAETGVITWSPTSGDVGGHVVIVQATDPLGSYDVQTYTLSVSENIPNRPPLFTTIPIVDAYLHTTYFYDSDASDPDGDDLTYSLVDGPQGMAIDADTGAISWDVTDVSLVGTLVSVTLKVTETGESGAGHEATQEYLIAVHEAIGNHDPIIISDPQLTFELPGFSGNTATGDVTPTELELHLSAGEVSEQIVSLDYEYDGNFSADIVLIVDESVSMTGGQAWLDEIAEALNAELEAAGYFENRFAIVGFTADSAVLSTVDDPFRVSVYGPDDALVKSVWVPERELFSSALAGWELPSSGEYSVVVENTDGSTATEYSFVLETVEEDVSTQSLTLGTSYSGTIETYAAQDDYTFTIASNDTLVLFDALEHNDQLQWSLTGPGGEVVTDRLLDHEDLVLSLDSGSYTLSIAAVGFRSEDYQFRLVDLSAATSVTLGDSTSGTLDPVGESVGYAVTISTAARYDFTAESWDGSAAARWRLVDDTGTDVFNALLSETQSLVSLAVGDYVLIIDGDVDDPASQPQYQFTVESGTYSLSGTAISLDQTVSDNLTSGQYNFTLSADALVYFDVTEEISGGTTQTMSWTLEGADGTFVSSRWLEESNAGGYSGSDPDPLVFDLSAGGYNLTIDNSSLNDYEFRVVDIHSTLLSGVSSLTLDTVVNGTLNSARETHSYTFSATVGDVLAFDALTSAAQSSARWRLIGPDGSVLSTNGLLTDLPVYVITQTGDYALLIEGGTDDSSTSRTYSFEVQSLRLATVGSLTDGTLAADETHRYGFTLDEDALLYFDALTDEADFAWQLLDSSGSTIVSQRLFTASDGDDVSDANAVLDLSAGTYVLDILSLNSATGDYDLRLVNLADVAASDFLGTTGDALSAGNSTDVYRFQAIPGDTLTIDVSSYSGPSGSQWRVVNLDGTVIDSGLISASQDTVSITAHGEYYLLIEGDISDTASSQSYTLDATLSQGGTPTALTLGSTTSGTINSADTFDVYSISGTAGQELFLDWLSGATTDMTLWLRDADGNLLLSESRSEESDYTKFPLVTLATTGTYTLLVGDAAGGTGAYSFRVLDKATQSQLVLDDETSSVFTATDEDRLYRFSGTAGQKMVLRLDAWADAEDVDDMTSRLKTEGVIEDGYEAIHTALNGLNFRDKVSRQLVLITDEDRDTTDANLTYNTILDELDEHDASLHSLLDVILNEVPGSGPYALGADGDTAADNMYWIGTGGDYTVTSGTAPNLSTSWAIETEYIDLTFDADGTVWDGLTLEWGVPDEVNSFIAALADVIRGDVSEDLDVTLTASDPNVQFEILTKTYNGTSFDFDVRITGDGNPHAFDLQFVRENNPGVVVGTIPTEIWVDYFYDVDAIDPDNDELTYTLVGETHGATFDNETGLLRWAPTVTGEYEFTALVEDGRGGSDLQTWTVTVGDTTSGNTAPVLASAGPFTIQSGRPFEFMAVASDVDGDALQYQILDIPGSANAKPAGMTIDPLTGVVSWTPDVLQAGEYDIVIRAADGRGGIDSITVSITVVVPTIIETLDNAHPVIVSTPVTSAMLGIQYTYDVQATDADLDPLLYELALAPDGMAIDPVTGLISWVPSFSDLDDTIAGQHHVAVRVTDGRGGIALQKFIVDLQAGLPIITSSPNLSATVGTEWTYQLTASDPDLPNDVLEYELTYGPDGATIGASDGLLSWTPTATGTNLFVVTVYDLAGHGYQQMFLLPVIDTGSNTAPTILSTPRTHTIADQTFLTRITASDPEGEVITYSLIDGPSTMTIDGATGMVQWLPGLEDVNAVSAPHQYTVRATDARGLYDEQTFDLHVVAPLVDDDGTSVNHSPEITSTPDRVWIVDKLYRYQATATDADGDQLLWSLDSDVANMEIDPATGELLWLPDASQIGNTEVTIRVIDPFGGLATQSFLISVSDSNHPPEITSDPPQSGRSGEAYTYNVEATDPDEDTLVYALDNPPTGMSIDPDTGLISWTPSSEGSHSVTVTATDPSGWYAYQTYDLTIYAPASNLPPQINSNPEPTGMVGTVYSYQVNATDPDEDELDYSLGGTPPIGMSIDPDTGLLTWTPAAGQTGVHSVQVIVSDGTDTDDQTFEISVRDNAAPVLTAIPDGTLTAGQLYEFDVSATDADGDALTYSLLGAPSNMTIDAGTGRIRWQTTLDDINLHPNITVAVTDPFGLYDTHMFDLDVVPPAAEDGGDGNSGDGGGPSINSYPYITSTPSYTAVVDNLYLYQATATDPDHDPLEWLLDSSVRNMQIDRDTGLVSWSPDEDQIGDVEVKVRARDPFGASSQQTFLISVVGTNQTPLFTTDPITSGRVGDDYSYAANAIDPDGDPLTYALLDEPTGMTIDPITGVISWTPGATGTSEVIVTATDPSGLAAEQTYQLVITAAATNGRPEITSTPDWIALVGSEYTYQVTATDPDDDTLEYSLVGTPPSGISIDPDTGLLTWTPSGGQTGIHSVEVIASDGSLGIGQNFDLLVRDNVAPTIAPIPDLTRAAGETYQFRAYGSDTDGDALTYELSGEPAGMTINPVSGDIEWLTTIDDIGTYADITVTVTDPYGLSASETFDLKIIAPPTSGGGSNQNGGPHITSTGGSLAIVGEQYTYQATATDPDGDILLWSLETDVANMEINPTTGELLWTPDASQIGTVSFSILVSDPYGAWSLQDIHVAVMDNNLPPQFTSTPPASGHSDEDYTYNVTATDPEEETLTFSLSDGPSGMTINPNTGVLTWTPTGEGTFDVVVTVADPSGYAVHQDYDLTIFAPAANLPPQITSTAVLTGMVGTAYSYQVTATDPEDDTLEFSLGGTPPSGMSIDPDTGLLSWTPTSGQTGLNTFEVIVSDGNDTDTQYLGISIRDNTAPTITTIPDATVTAGNGYQYDVLAADADGDALTYSISGEPTGMTIDADTGRIEWQTAIGDIGAHTNIAVTVTDEFGLYITDTFDVTVAADDTPPVVDVTYSHDPARLGTPLSIYIQAVDDVGVDEITLDINGVDVAVDANGNAVYDVVSLDPLVVTVTATDTVDNETIVVDNLTVIDPGDVTAPVVAITSITGGEELTEPTDILGTVDDLDDNLVYWTLIATAIDSGRKFTLATGGNEITTPALLGNFDTTAIANGLYRLTLTAVDAGGNTATDNKLVTVEGNLKLGSFSISFLDMQIPAPGFPITITRSYSTLDAGEQGDFGYGWSLDIANTSVNVEHADSGLSNHGPYTPFKNGDRVVITLPDGTTEGFTFYAEPAGGLASIVTHYKPRFVADSGVDSELFVDDAILIPSGDEWVDHSKQGFAYNPALEEFGNAYVLRLRTGVELTINASTGELASIHDRHGNALYFTGDGIESSNGRGVDFTRDYAGRITKITDHVGNYLIYEYDQETGNLIAVTDRTGATTQFTYLDGPNDPEHYLDEIIDPLGRTAATTTYDEQGRVETITDADGQTISYTYDSGNKTQTITDQLNYTSTVTFDARGNITREEDPLGGITKRTFDDDDNLLTEIMVIGLEDTVSEETNDLLTTYTYDTNGFVASVITPDNLETTYVNHETGTPLTVIDPLGNPTQTVVDEYGRPLYLIDALENRTQLIYYGVGTHAADNGQVRYIVTPWKTDDYHGPSDNTAVSFEYDEEGNLISTTNWDQWSTPANAGDGNYQTNRFSYDDYGNQIGTSRLWQDPNDSENTVTLTTSSNYDDNNRLISHTDAYGHTSTTTYDAAGQVIATTRIIGQDDNISSETNDQTTTMLYDPRGQNIQTTYSDGTITRTVYDAKGRAVYTTDRHLPADDTNGTYYIYDALDRVIETRRHKDLVITITDNNGDFTSAYTSKGAELSSSSSTYDAVSGWLLSTSSSSGSTTTYEYDDFGRTKKITETIGSSSRETNYTYDDFGRQELFIDSYDRETATFYDEYGRVKRTIHHDGTFSETTYDSFGRVATTTDRFGNTRTNTYDGTVGRLIKTETSAGVVTEYEYDYYGQQTSMEVTADNVTARTEYEYDQFGRQVLVRDALGRETSYDYDEYGNVIKTTFDDDSYVTSTYDDFGMILSETDALGNTKNYEYDELGRLTAVILPEVEHPDTSVMVRPGYEYEYDEFGNRTVIRDNIAWIDNERTYNHDNVAGNDYRETLFTYDDFGNQLTRELPMGQTEYFEYDEETLRLIQHTDFEGNITESVYSDLGFLDELQYFAPGSDPETDPADETVEYTYNSLDQRSQITDERGDTDYTYDEFDRLAQIDTPEGALNYEYDNYGRQVRKSIGNPADPTHDWTYSYDALGRLKTVSTVRRNGVDLTEPEVTTYSYDLVGNLSRVDYANGMITTYEYDALNRLDVMTHYSPDETPENLADNDKLAEYDYTVRADGRRTAVTEKYWESGTAYTTDIAWTYDSLGRLIEEDYDSHDNDLDYTTTFTYDLVGNRLSKVIDGVVDKTLTYEYDDNDRLLTSWKVIGDVDDGVNLETDDTTTTYGYTGTLQTSKTVKETYSNDLIVVTAYDYNLQGRMATVTIDAYDANGDVIKTDTSTYVYSVDDIRVTSTRTVKEDDDQNPATALVVTLEEETAYLVDGMNFTGYAQVVEEVTRDVSTQNVTKALVFTVGHDVIDQTSFIPGNSQAGAALMFVYDGHGSTRALADETAAIVERYSYTAYGLPVGFDPAVAQTALLYSGEWFEATVGLQYLRARWYDPNDGRFNRLDPFSGNLSDPQSLHKYLYTHGDPVNSIDPTGMFSLIGLVVSMVSSLSTDADTLTVGGFTKAALLTGGKAAFDARSAALRLIMEGEWELGMLLHNRGTKLLGLTFDVIETFDTGVGVQQVAGTLLTAGIVGAVKLGDAADDLVEHSQNIFKKTDDVYDPNWTSSLIPGKGKTGANSSILRKNLALDDMIAHGFNYEMHAHHIVASGADASKAGRELLEKYQIDINSAVNGIPLTRPEHYTPGLHSGKTLKRINNRLEDAVKGIEDWATGRNAVIDELANIRKDILAGILP